MKVPKYAIFSSPKKRGRPSKYRPGGYQLACAYEKTCIDVFDANGALIRAVLPSVEGFARYLGVHRDTLYSWAKYNEEYRSALLYIKSEQKDRLLDGGLGGLYQASIVGLMLRSNHGMRIRRRESTKLITHRIVRMVYELADKMETEEKQQTNLRTLF